MRNIVLFGILCGLGNGAGAAPAGQPDGKMLYQDNCAACHGEAGRGAEAPKLLGTASLWPSPLFRRAVLAGIDQQGKALSSDMPHWQDSSFSSDQGAAPTAAEVDAIQQYLQSQK